MTDCFAYLAGYTCIIFFCGERVVMVFLVMKGAIIHVLPSVLFKDLHKENISPSLCNLIKQFLTKQSLYITFLSDPPILVSTISTSGLAQGSVMSSKFDNL